MIELQGVTVRFDDRMVLDSVDLCIKDNETMVILGASGSGKSTILRVIIGLVKPNEGRILIDGEDVTDYNEKKWNIVRKKMGMVFQYSALFDSMTVGENVAFGLRQHSNYDENTIREKVAQTLELVGLEGREGDLPGNLSGGMKKRVSLARAIATEPRIVLYDEPTAGLDPIRSAAVDRLINEAQEKLHTTSIVVTHELKSARTVADRMAFLHEGRFIAIAPTEAFWNSSVPEVQQFLQGREELPVGEERI